MGVQRQYTGTAGRIENAQVAVYLTYAGCGGHTFIDRRLYPPKSWTGDPLRMAEAGAPQSVRFATKLAMAAEMITDAMGAGVTARWAAGTRSTVPTRTCVRPVGPAGSGMCWRSDATGPSLPSWGTCTSMP